MPYGNSDTTVAVARGPTSDADQLAALTHIPAVVWITLFAVFSLIALCVGGRWLLLTSS